MSVDNLTLSSGSGQDNLARASGAGKDDFGLSSAGGQDNLARSSGSGQDNYEQQWFTLAAETDTLDDTTPIDMDVDNASNFDAGGGNAKITNRDDGEEMDFTYTGVTGNTLEGCLISSGTFDFAIGDQVKTQP